MSLYDYINKKNVFVPQTQVKLSYENFLEQMGFAIYSLDFKKNHVFVENFLVNKDLENIDVEDKTNYFNKLRCKQILDDKDVLKLKENFAYFCKVNAEKAKSYLEFLLKNYNDIEASIELNFNEGIFPEYELLLNLNGKKFITSYRLNEVKNAFDEFLHQENKAKIYKDNCVFYGISSKENHELVEAYIKNISWSLPAEIPNCVSLVTNLDNNIVLETHAIVEIKASIDDVFIHGKDIHIINENFIPKRIRWIKI